MTDIIAPSKPDTKLPPPSPYGWLKPIRGWITLAAILQSISSILVLVPLMGVSELVQVLNLDAPDRAGSAWHIITLSCTCLAGGVALRGLADLTTHLADNAFALWLRRKLAHRLARAPLGWFTDNNSGRIKQGMQDDVSAIHHLIAHAWLNLANACATLVVVYGYLLWIDWHMTLVTLVPLGVFLALYLRMMKGSHYRMHEYGMALERVNQSVVEFVQGITIVKTFGQHGKAFQAYRTAVDSFHAFFVHWATPLIKPECLSRVIIAPITLLLLVLASGIGFINLGMISVWQLLPFTLVALGISLPVTTLSASVPSLQRAQGALARLAALLTVPQQPEPECAQRPCGNQVEIQQLSFSYPQHPPLLRDVSLSLIPGTVTALVGASGSGKTTLAKMLLRYADPQQGRVTLGGVDLCQIASDALYRQVGAVFQEAHLLRISLFDNIALGNPQASEAQVLAAARAAQIHTRIMQLPHGYQSIYDEDIGLSGGEAQRIAIARALLLNPGVLILDEPTAQADVESEAAIHQACNQLMAQQPQQVVLVIAHRLETVMHADNIVVMHQGRIVEQGPHQTLLAAEGVYARMWASQQAPAREAVCC